MEFRNEIKFDTYNGMPLTYEQMEMAVEANWVHPAFRDGVITVDKLLDYADVVLEWYVPSVEAIEFFNFIRLVLGEEPENSNPKAHYFLIDCIFQSPNVKPYFQVRGIDYELNKDRIVVMCTREFGKSVILGTMLPLYMADKGMVPNFGKVNYTLYVSDSMRNNVKTTMETIGSVYRESIYLLNQFEDSTTNQDEIKFVRKPRTPQEIALYEEYVIKQGKKPSEVPGRMKRTFAMKGIGASTGGRGSREALQRPQVALFDDLIGNEADATSEAILDNIESTIEKDVLPALHGSKSLALLIGTPFNKNDPVYRRIEGGMWLPVVFPKAEKISIDLKPEEFRGVWPDRHSYEACMRDFKRAWRAKEAGDPIPMRGLMQEYYLRISNDDDRMIRDEYISWFSRDDIARNAWNYNWYITTDLTTTAGSGSDLAGIALWAVSWNGDWYLMDLTLRKLEVEEQYNEIFAMVAQTVGNIRTSVEVGVEIDGQQSLHLIALRERMPRKNIYFVFARQKGAKIGSEGIRSKLEGGNKHWRFRLMLPMFQNHKIHFAKELKGTMDMNELLEEIKYATYSGFGTKHDDGCDTISQIGMIDARYPPKNVEPDPKKVSYKDEAINAKIWGKRHEDEEEDTVYDSYA